MTTSSGAGSPPSSEGRPSRQERLAAELRANLKRRKAKGRTPSGSDPAEDSLRLEPEREAENTETP